VINIFIILFCFFSKRKINVYILTVSEVTKLPKAFKILSAHLKRCEIKKKNVENERVTIKQIVVFRVGCWSLVTTDCTHGERTFFGKRLVDISSVVGLKYNSTR